MISFSKYDINTDHDYKDDRAEDDPQIPARGSAGEPGGGIVEGGSKGIEHREYAVVQRN